MRRERQRREWGRESEIKRMGKRKRPRIERMDFKR